VTWGDCRHSLFSVTRRNTRWEKPVSGRNVSISRIAEFWCDYCLACDAPFYYTQRIDQVPTPVYSGSRYLICQNPENHQNQSYFRTYIDFGEPECLSCGQFLGETPLVKNSSGYWGERAHIIAWSISHDSRPENVVPLCHACHKANPTWTRRRLFLDWLIARKKQKKENADIWQKQMESSSIIRDCLNKYCSTCGHCVVCCIFPTDSSVLNTCWEKVFPYGIGYPYDPLMPFGGYATVENVEDVALYHQGNPHDCLFKGRFA
jgi:hypothetical protein